MADNDAEGICIPQHKTFEERLDAARLCEQRLGLTIPTLIDAMDNAACEWFAAWPERIYVAGRDGRIMYKGAPGPWGFDTDAAEVAVRRLLE
jgi:Iodothyronine deiodinase